MQLHLAFYQALRLHTIFVFKISLEDPSTSSYPIKAKARNHFACRAVLLGTMPSICP